MQMMNDIKEWSYSESDNTLRVVYQGGTVVDYNPLNPESFTAMMAEDYLNYAIHREIRRGNLVGMKKVGH